MPIRAHSLMYLACVALCLSCLLPVPAHSQSIAPGVGRMKKSSHVVAQVTQEVAPQTPLSTPAKAADSTKGLPADLQIQVSGDPAGHPLIDFGFLLAQQASTPQTATITNSSTDTYQVNVTSISQQIHTLSVVTCKDGLIVKGTPCTITFTYKPTIAETIRASVTLRLVDTNTHVSTDYAIALKGNAGGLKATIPTAMTTVTNGPHTVQTIHLTTADGKAPTVQSIAVVGANADNFYPSDCMPFKKECRIQVYYETTVAENGSAILMVTVDNHAYSIPLNGTTASCVDPIHPFMPLAHSDVETTTINCFYNSSSSYSFASQVKYLYSPAGSANVVSSDLFALNFPNMGAGLQIALDGNASTSSCTQAASSSSASGNTSQSQVCGTASGSAASSARRKALPLDSSSNSNSPSIQQAIDSLEKGGDFALRLTLPLANWRRERIQTLAFVTPRAGLTINGLTAQNTVTNATQLNAFLPLEGYAQFDAIPASDGGDSPGSIFIDYRGGWDIVSSTFANNAGLDHKNFALQYLSVGAVFNGSIRISAQRYFGPNQSFVDGSGNTVTTNAFRNWQIGVQITPTNVKQ